MTTKPGKDNKAAGEPILDSAEAAERLPPSPVEPIGDETPTPIRRIVGALFGSRINVSHQMLVRIVIAAAVIIFAVFSNRSFLAWGLFAVLAVLFLPINRTRSFVLAFAPYGAIWAIFTFLRSFADETPLATITNLYVLHFERWLFDGQIPTITLQSRFYDTHHLHWWDFYFTFTHWSYFFIPHVLAFRLWQVYPQVFRRYLAALTILLAVGLTIYFLIPTNPPWLSDDSSTAAAPTVTRIMEAVGKRLGGGLYQASYDAIGESNPIAAMPSIHLATTFLLIFPAGYFGRRWRLLAIYYALSMATALIYLGEHYFTDCAVGAAIATYAWWASGAWVRHIVPIIGRGRQTGGADEVVRAPVGATSPSGLMRP